jgi:hypothetical protein
MFGQRVPDSVAFREAVGQEIIDRIVSRTTGDNKSRTGKQFRGYSEAYVNSEAFAVFGKSAANVNLTLSGDMLNTLDVVDSGPNFITIGFSVNEVKGRAHGHVRGIKRRMGNSKKSKMGKVRRDFFGLPDGDYRRIAEGFTIPSLVPTDAEVEATSLLVTLRELFGGEEG